MSPTAAPTPPDPAALRAEINRLNTTVERLRVRAREEWRAAAVMRHYVEELAGFARWVLDQEDIPPQVVGRARQLLSGEDTPWPEPSSRGAHACCIASAADPDARPRAWVPTLDEPGPEQHRGQS